MDSSISLANTLSQCFQTITIAVVHCSVGRNFCSTCRKQLLLQEAEPPRKASRRLPGKTRPVVATFGGDDFPQASGRPGPSLLRRAQRPDNSSPRPPLQRNFVEAVQSIGSQRVSRFGYARHVRNVGAHSHACGVCREVEIGRHAAHDCVALWDGRVRPEAMIWGRKPSLIFLIFTLAAGEICIYSFLRALCDHSSLRRTCCFVVLGASIGCILRRLCTGRSLKPFAAWPTSSGPGSTSQKGAYFVKLIWHRCLGPIGWWTHVFGDSCTVNICLINYRLLIQGLIFTDLP